MDNLIVKKYNRGEMYWYINHDVKKEDYMKEGVDSDFLDNRPVLILSDYVDEYNSSVIVIPTTTSSHRNGINITVKDGDGNDINTKLMPMRIRTVPIKYLKGYIGKVSDDILKYAYKSLYFHLGENKEIPEYIILDKKIHASIAKSKQKETSVKNNENNNMDQVNTNIIYNKYEGDLIRKYRLTYGNLFNINTLVTDKDIVSNVYKINSCKKYIKKKYHSLNIDVKFNCLSDKPIDVAKKLSITVKDALVIKGLCRMEFAILQSILLNKLLKHEVEIKNLSRKFKYVFLTILNLDLVNYVKKAYVINLYKNQFMKELNLINE